MLWFGIKVFAKKKSIICVICQISLLVHTWTAGYRHTKTQKCIANRPNYRTWLWFSFTCSQLWDLTFFVLLFKWYQNNGRFGDYIHFHCTISLATFKNWQNMRWTLLCFSVLELSKVKWKRKKKLRKQKAKILWRKRPVPASVV